MKKTTEKIKAEVQPKAVIDLSELETFCGAPMTVRCVVRGQPFDFTGRRLKPVESHEIQMLLERAVPPIIVEEGQPNRYNLEDAEYKKMHEVYRKQARAMAIWLAFPCFKMMAEKEVAGVGSGLGAALPAAAEQVAAWMGKRQLEEDILDGLFSALTRKEVESYLGFTSGSSSPKS